MSLIHTLASTQVGCQYVGGRDYFWVWPPFFLSLLLLIKSDMWPCGSWKLGGLMMWSFCIWESPGMGILEEHGLGGFSLPSVYMRSPNTMQCSTDSSLQKASAATPPLSTAHSLLPSYPRTNKTFLLWQTKIQRYQKYGRTSISRLFLQPPPTSTERSRLPLIGSRQAMERTALDMFCVLSNELWNITVGPVGWSRPAKRPYTGYQHSLSNSWQTAFRRFPLSSQFCVSAEWGSRCLFLITNKQRPSSALPPPPPTHLPPHPAAASACNKKSCRGPFNKHLCLTPCLYPHWLSSTCLGVKRTLECHQHRRHQITRLRKDAGAAAAMPSHRLCWEMRRYQWRGWDALAVDWGVSLPPRQQCRFKTLGDVQFSLSFHVISVLVIRSSWIIWIEMGCKDVTLMDGNKSA